MEYYVGIKLISATRQDKDNVNEAPPIGGYKVVYEDGYESWSPKWAFEQAYKRSGEMGFSEALYLLKRGYALARRGWNGKDMFIVLITNWGCEWGNIDESDGEYEAMDFIGMKIADDKFVPWLASQTDMLAEDWEVIDIE